MSDVAARRPTELCEAGAARSGKTRNWIVIPAKAYCCPEYFLRTNETRWAAYLCGAPRLARLDLAPPLRHPRESGDPEVRVRRTTLDPRFRGGDGAFFELRRIWKIYSGQQRAKAGIQGLWCKESHWTPAFARVTERFLIGGGLNEFIPHGSAPSWE